MTDPRDLVAHRAPLLLLDEVLETGPEHALARTRVDGSAWYADGTGAMPAWFGIELMAQTIAAYSGAFKRPAGGVPKLGYLLGTRSYTCTEPAWPAGAELLIRADLHYLDETGLSAFRCSLHRDGQPVAEALLKTFEAP